MPIHVKIEDFNGIVISEYNDQKGVLNSILNYCYQNPDKLKVIKYIDLYDDTMFNSLQIRDLIFDINYLKTYSNFMSDDNLHLFSALLNMCNEALNEPHQYLKFYGD